MNTPALAPLPRLTNYGLALRHMRLASYYAGYAARLRQHAIRAARIGDVESSVSLVADVKWYRAHAAELRDEAGARLRMIRAHGMTERYTDCDAAEAGA